MTIKLCITILLLTLVTASQLLCPKTGKSHPLPSVRFRVLAQSFYQHKPLEFPLNDPHRLNAPISEVKLSRAVLAEFSDGDYVEPTFSPDGKVLARSKVLVRDDFENTEVWLFNLSTREDSVLLDAKTAATYSTYKAYVSGMTWTSANRLEVSIGDGDVGTTYLVFDPIRRKLLSERSEDFFETDFLELSPDAKRLYEQARSRFPSFPPEVLNGALQDPATLVIPGKGIVLQKRYAGHDQNVWFLDFQNRSANVLVKLSENYPSAFHGGLSFNSSIILLLSGGTTSYLVLYKNGESKVLGKFNGSPYRGVEVKHVSPSRIIFLVRTHAPSERGDNPLFIFDGEKLLRITDYAPLHDAGIDPLGRRIAYSYWKDDKRHIAVRELAFVN